MNDLSSKFKDTGLSVIGVTGETANLTEPWVEKHKMAYPYAYDKGLSGMSKLGLKAFPSAVLVDATGTVVYKGHPSKITGEMVRNAVVGALPTPAFEWPKSAKGVRKEFLKDKLDKALAAAHKMGSEGEDVAASIQGVIEARAAHVESLFESGDYLGTQEMGERTAKALNKLPERARVDTVLAELKADKEAQAILKAQLKVRKMIPDRIKKKDRPRLLDQLRKIAKQYPGTAAARDAEKAMQRVRS